MVACRIWVVLCQCLAAHQQQEGAAHAEQAGDGVQDGVGVEDAWRGHRCHPLLCPTDASWTQSTKRLLGALSLGVT